VDKIFIQIASYRDIELPLTIRSALSSAKYPERLTFGICWQYDEKTFLDLDEFNNDPRFRISQFYYEESRGCCWARHQTSILYRDETYTLQIDAHTRFAQDWDERFIDMFNSINAKKPLLTTYPAPFEYINGDERRYTDRGIQRLILNRMLTNLTTIYKSEVVEDTSKPAPSKFIAAGQIFTLGEFCREVEYDPELYYSGEEISLAVRAYTQGYDFYCPNEDLLWHFYQHSMPTHDGDHQDNQHLQAIERLNTLLVDDHTKLGKYGLGDKRTLAEFEAYAEIDFLQALNRKPVKCHYKANVRLDLSRVEERDDYDFWILALRDIDGNELYRIDLTTDQLPDRQNPFHEFDVELDDQPITYMLWPHTHDNGFLRQVAYDIPAA